MAQSDDLLIAVQADTAKAAKSLEDITVTVDELGKSVEGMSHSVSSAEKVLDSFGVSAVKIEAVMQLAEQAFELLKKGVEESIGAFIQFDDISKRLSATLQAVGNKDVAEVTQRFHEFAEEISHVTTISEEHVLQLSQMALATGKSEEQTKKLIVAAAGLAPTVGGVDNAFHSLLGSYRGVIRELAVLDPNLKNLTEEQLKNGAAVEVLGRRFQNLAKSDAETLGGSIKQIKNTFEEFLKTIGEVIVRSLGMGDGFNGVLVIMQRMLKSFNDSKEAIIVWGKVIVGSIIGTIDLMGQGFAGFAAIAVTAWEAVTSPIETFKISLSSIIPAFVSIGAISKETGQTVMDALKPSTETVEKFKGIGEGFKAIFTGAAHSINELAGNTNKATHNADALNQQWDKNIKTVGLLSKEAQKLAEELAKKLIELQKHNAEIGLEGTKLAEAKAVAEDNALHLMEEQLRKSGALKDAQVRHNLELAYQATTQSVILQHQAIEKKNLEELTAKNKDLNLTVDSYGKSQQTVIQMELDRQKEILKIQMDKLDAQHDLTDAVRAQFEEQTKLIEQAAKNKQAEVLKQSGPISSQIGDLGKTIGNFSGLGGGAEGGEGAASAAGGMAEQASGFLGQLSSTFSSGAAGIVGAVVAVIGAIIDAILGILDTFAKFFDKVATFPQKLLDGVKNLISSAVKFTSDFIPQLFEKIPDIIGDILDAAFEKLPDAAQKVFDNLPSIIDKFVKRIPELVEKLYQGLIGSSFKISAGLITAIIKGVPQIIGSIVREVPEIVKALIMGIINGFKEIGQAFLDLFSGKGPTFNNLGNAISDGFIKSVKKAAGSTSQLFKVEDLTAVTDSAEQRTKDLLIDLEKRGKSLIDLLIEAWRNLWTKYLKPFIDGIIGAWQTVWEKFIQPGLELLKTTWAVLINNLQVAWNGLMGVLRATWDAVISNLTVTWHALMDLLKTSWSVATDTLGVVWKVLIANLMAAWDEIKIIWNGMIAILGSAWNEIKIIWDGMMKVLSSAWDTITGIFKDIWDGVKGIWQTMMDLFQGKIGFLQAVGQIWDTIMSTASSALERVGGFFKTVFDAAVAAFQGVWEMAKTIFGTIVAAFEGAWNQIKTFFEGILNMLGAAADGFDRVFKSAVAGLGAIWTNAIDGAKNIGAKIWEGVMNSFNAAVDGVKAIGAKIWEGLHTAFATFASVFNNLGSYIWDGLKNAFGAAGNFFGDIGTKMWNGLKDGLNGIGSLLTNIFNSINPGNLFNKIFNVPPQPEGGTVEKTLGINIPFVTFAEGGLIPGSAPMPGDSKMNDRIVAMLSPGEAVIPRSMMANPVVREMVKNILDGRFKPPGYSLGGKILSGDIKGAVADVKNLTPAQVGKEIGNAADVLNPAKILEGLWSQARTKAFEAVTKMFEANKFATGGYVGDNIPAMLSDGEFVVNRRGVAAVGVDALKAINAGAVGGRSTAGPATVNIEMNLDIQTKEAIDETYVRTKLMPAIKKELKRASLDGQIVLAPSGIGG